MLQQVKETHVNELVVLPRFAPGDFDEIYHLAAAVGVRLVISQPVHTIETNILETSAVLRLAAGAATPTPGSAAAPRHWAGRRRGAGQL